MFIQYSDTVCSIGDPHYFRQIYNVLFVIVYLQWTASFTYLYVDFEFGNKERVSFVEWLYNVRYNDEYIRHLMDDKADDHIRHWRSNFCQFI
jgi:hypothetical protein